MPLLGLYRQEANRKLTLSGRLLERKSVASVYTEQLQPLLPEVSEGTSSCCSDEPEIWGTAQSEQLPPSTRLERTSAGSSTYFMMT
jgi:hypothetical protein